MLYPYWLPLLYLPMPLPSPMPSPGDRPSRIQRLIQRLWAWFLAGIIVTVIPSWVVAALTYDQVDAIASQVTVVIAQG